jgi:transposase
MKVDGRTLSHEASETIRKMAVKRVLEGESPSAVMKSYGLCRTTIYRWLRAHKKGGEAALQSRPSTAGRGDKEKLQVRRWICGKDPRQYGFDFGLWTRRIVVELVEEKFDKKLWSDGRASRRAGRRFAAFSPLADGAAPILSPVK